VLASLRLLAVVTGLGIAALAAALLATTLSLILTVIGIDDAPQIGLTAGILLGLLAGGYASGRMAVVAHRFHGSVTGLLTAALVLIIARLGGSPAPTAPVLWLALLAVVVGGLGGSLAGRRSGA
jgi:putative membrane protein (TIGR04086 family)